MAEAKPLKRGDACPRCGGEFADARVPTDAQYAAATNREDPIPLPEGADTASPTARAELGTLARCKSCSYSTRFPVDPKAGKKSSKSDDE